MKEKKMEIQFNIFLKETTIFIEGVPITTVFFQMHTAPTKMIRFQKLLHCQFGNELTFMWVLFITISIDFHNTYKKNCIKWLALFFVHSNLI